MATLTQIERHLKQRKLQYKIIDLEAEAFTVSDVVRAGISEDEVVKTLVARGTKSITGIKSQQFVALALRGKDRLDFKKVRRLFGSKSELAKPDEVLKVVGVPIGAVCPVLVGIPLYFDEKVTDLKNVHIGSGDLMHGLEMKLSDLLAACSEYEISDLATSH
ncbi:MAG: YbaK/prolyl-tRNA synthetase associated region [Candidatus Curtissbacteria bacterium GW2011_GWA1_40_16]|uniref:YbaK/prolyl-tRNA synthetase associated region n=1 Tax=Candidatus Curtissbacteria bacterium GW2011_GWA1_40_16 TaxID=1618405 RepID=A0A0G0RFC1_9BACT|nr:MAG: YbaK/prolyl-tRNA synthetase associated region [Candidatus Curtissbacteria bacterium GW2011_GWA1_40_16]